MKHRSLLSLAAAAALIFALPQAASATPDIGKPAPAFNGTDSRGQTVSLAALKGKTVVLEWTNHECPFVKKHYDSGNMQKVQKEALEHKNVIWVSINSSAPGKQGHVDTKAALEIIKKDDAHPTHYLIDESGEIGKLYEAKTTPHMFIIDKEGTLAYEGAIDDKPSPRPASLEGAQNYVLAALKDLHAGHTVQTPATKPYGCSVKYAH